MEINITELIDIDLMQFSASPAEIGQNAGRITWENALKSDICLIKNKEELRTCKDYLKEFGAWEESEIEEWGLNETNALILQMVSGDLREYLRYEKTEGFSEWNENFGGRIGKSKDNKNYYYYT